MSKIYDDQPESDKGLWNRVEYRPLEGFVYAITPFNFTAIAGNLPASAAMMGNVVIWKPSDSQIFSAKVIVDIFKEAVKIEKEFICEALPCKLIGMNSELMSQYIEFVADRISLQLGYSKIYNVSIKSPDMKHSVELVCEICKKKAEAIDNCHMCQGI